MKSFQYCQLLAVLITLSYSLKIEKTSSLQTSEKWVDKAENGRFESPALANTETFRTFPNGLSTFEGWNIGTGTIRLVRSQTVNTNWTTGQVCNFFSSTKISIWQNVELEKDTLCEIEFDYISQIYKSFYSFSVKLDNMQIFISLPTNINTDVVNFKHKYYCERGSRKVEIITDSSDSSNSIMYNILVDNFKFNVYDSAYPPSIITTPNSNSLNLEIEMSNNKK